MADQLLIAPPSLVAFFYCQSRLEGTGHEQSKERSMKAFVPTYRTGLVFWCCVHTITFGVINPRYRIAWASLCSVGWNAFMSNANKKASEAQQEI